MKTSIMSWYYTSALTGSSKGFATSYCADSFVTCMDENFTGVSVQGSNKSDRYPEVNIAGQKVKLKIPKFGEN